MAILEMLVTFFLSVIRIVQFLMLARAIFSWIPVPESLSGLYMVIYKLTEPLIMPFRKLFYKTKLVQKSPIDISFLITILVLEFFRYMFVMLL